LLPIQGAEKLPIYTSIGDTPKTDKPRVVILGSGWGAVSMLKSLPKDIANNYEIVVVSPRNYFLYTPLLPAVATGEGCGCSVRLLIACGSPVACGAQCWRVARVRPQGRAPHHTALHHTTSPSHPSYPSTHPSAGTMEERSIVEPVRNLVVGKGAYYEAMAKAIDTERKQLVACFPADAGLDEACFQISYDVLIVAVGSVNNTFGIQVRGRKQGAGSMW
jgi:NADH dehydrogenase FAD-containing subunit